MGTNLDEYYQELGAIMERKTQELSERDSGKYGLRLLYHMLILFLSPYAYILTSISTIIVERLSQTSKMMKSLKERRVDMPVSVRT